eukprot:364214-Rhodomonas_salina.2
MGRTNWLCKNCSHEDTWYAPISCMWPSMMPQGGQVGPDGSVAEKQCGYRILTALAQSGWMVMVEPAVTASVSLRCIYAPPR